MTQAKAAKAKVLLVDDEPDLLEAIQDAICDYFEDVYTANSVKQAIEILGSKKVDVVLSDFRMPGQDGLDLRNYVIQNHPSVTFFMLTGYANDPKIMEALKSEKFTVLDKPVHPSIIVDRIQSSLYAPEIEDAVWQMYKEHLTAEEAEEFLELDKQEQANRLKVFVAKNKIALKKITN